MGFAAALRSLFGLARIDEGFFEGLEDALVESDIGPMVATCLVDDLRAFSRRKGETDEGALRDELARALRAMLKDADPERMEAGRSVLVVLGVNGVGKTTTSAKLAKLLARGDPSKVLLAAADTFRAAATNQLAIHGDRLGIRVVSQGHGADPGAVVFDALEAARSSGAEHVIVDTAGRLHNKQNLVRELEKIMKIVAARSEGAIVAKLLVLDATTGRNGFRQAEIFHEAVGVDAIVMTKLDSSAKGGTVFAAAKELGIPVAYACAGEGYDDISRFDPEAFVKGFLG